MSKSQDFENYNYDAFFAKLANNLDAFASTYDPDVRTLKVTANNSPDTCISVRVAMYDRIQLDCEIGNVGEDAKAYCREHTGQEGHLVFSARNDKVSVHIRLPLHLGQGWDDAVISSAAIAVNEMIDYLAKVKAA